MDINKILQGLGIDLSNPEAKKGAAEAIQAILQSRTPTGGGGGGFTPPGGKIDVEIDPDLIQPSIKNQPNPDGSDDLDIEIEDEEDILSQVKRNESDLDQDNDTSGKQSQNSEETSDSDESDSDESDDTTNSSKKDNSDTDKSNTKPDSNSEDSEETDETDESDNDNTDDFEDEETSEDDFDTDSSDEEDEESFDDIEDSDVEDSDELDDEDSELEDGDVDSTEGDSDGDNEDTDAEDEEDEDDSDFDEDDLIDDDLKGIKDKELQTKTDARKIKRERTLTAARNTLAAAQARKASPALIRELEKAIEALEALTEAVNKHIGDISDEEFNLLVNRVFDAIDALDDKSLTFTSDEERQQKVKEIKADISSANTQHELSAEDAAAIRAEHQAVKAREKENAKYQVRDRGSFKGFQDFLNSLYRAIALQVHHEEEQNDTWSAISRRNSGAGVIQQGKRIQDLNNKKIPVIDFYFDQSASWSSTDIQIGEKAVAALADMEAEGKIKINIYYFGDMVSNTNDKAQIGTGTSGWNEIVKNVISTNATNVIIMTDDDMENWWRPQDKPALTYTVPGYVWYLWKRGSNAPRLPRDLKGRGGVQQFSFSSADL
jgi:hypothetical protein